MEKNAPRLAHELHSLMKTDPDHKQLLANTLDLINFTWRKCRNAAQNMKHHTAPGASGISIDMLMLLPEEGWKILSVVFQTIIDTGVYPDSFKVGIITLLAKSPTSHGTLDNIRPITILESTYRLFTNMVSTRIAELFYKYDIITKEQHACLIGRGSTTPIMQMNAAMEHALDNTKNPKVGDQVKYKCDLKGPWITANVISIHKNGNYSLMCQDTMKQKRGVPREKSSSSVNQKSISTYYLLT